MKHTKTLTAAVLLAAFAVPALLAGCPDFNAPSKCFVLFTSGSGEKSNSLPLSDIQSMKVTLTRVVLYGGAASEGQGEGEAAAKQLDEGEPAVTSSNEGEAATEGDAEPAVEGEEGEIIVTATEEGETVSEGETPEPSGGKTVIFEGALRVDLMNLQEVSELLSTANIAPGQYKMKLSIEDPELVLNAQPDTPITDIQLTANDRLIVNTAFEIPAGQTSLILLDFGGIKLQEKGNGGYLLNPQLSVDISVQNAEVTVSGTIKTTEPLVLTLDDATEISIQTTDATTGLTGLTVNQHVTVRGTLSADGVLTALAVMADL